MSDEPLDPDVVELAEHLDAQRPRPGRGLRERVRGVLAAGVRQRILRRRSVWLVTSGCLAMGIAAVLAASGAT